MILNLYYIDGISRIDTPYFATNNSQATISKQQEYFAHNLVKSLEMAFYPPHYQNSIKFDSEDLTINDNVNYLSLEYQGKTYYYFIDSINYISEDIIKANITMDVIQTYMFDIFVSSGVIERKCIDRWNISDNKINRNYIRENVSSNQFQLSSHNEVTSDNTVDWFIFAKETKYDKNNTLGSKIANTYAWLSKKGVSSINPYTTPLSQVPYSIKISSVNDYSTDNFIDGDGKSVNGVSLFANASWLTETVDIYICPFNPFTTIKVTNELDNVYDIEGLKPHVNQLDFDGIMSDVYYFDFVGAIYVEDKVELLEFEFESNNMPSISFKSKYEPCLLDENYIQVLFGTTACNTTYPLYMLSLPSCYGHYFFNPLTGARLYYINDNNGVNYIYDPFRTLVVDSNILSLDLKNDAWAQYLSANKNRWSMLTINNASNITSQFVKGFTESQYLQADNNIITSFADVRFAETGEGLTEYESRALNRNKYSQRSNEMNVYASIGKAFGSIVNQALTEDNIKHVPPSPKQTGDFNNIVWSKMAIVIKELYKVNDYEQCAQYYHRNGNLVNEYVSNVDNIFEYVKNRYYFNMLKMQLPEVHLRNIIEDENTTNNIKQRLVNGIRLWNVIGGVEYDYFGTISNYYRNGTYEIEFKIPEGATPLDVPNYTITRGSSIATIDNIYLRNNKYYGRLIVSGASLSEQVIISYDLPITDTMDSLHIGNFEYDNVEMDYLQ